MILVLLLPTLAQAQVSIVNALPEIDADNGWNRKLSLSVSWRNDNTKETELLLSGAGAISYKESPWLFHFVAKGVHEQENGESTEGSVMEHFRTRLSIGELVDPLVAVSALSKGERVSRNNWYDGLYLEAFTQHEYDKFRALNARVLLGTGPAYAIVSNDQVGIMIGTAYMIEYLNFTGRTSNEFNHRWSNYLQVDIEPSDRFSIEGVTFAQFRIDEFSDHLLMATIALKVKATEWLGVELGVGIDYDSDPPPNIKEIGTGIRSAIFVEF
ncbi:MAG: DUF481 domain-containing protein [Promethearchaeota archaeon]